MEPLSTVMRALIIQAPGERHCSLGQQIEQILGVPEVDCAIDCVEIEAYGHQNRTEAPVTVLNSIKRSRGWVMGIPGLYVTGDPGAKDDDAKVGALKIRIGLDWSKTHSFVTGYAGNFVREFKYI